MKRVIATALFFALLSLIFFGAIYWFLQWGDQASANVPAPGNGTDGPTIKFDSAVAALVCAFILTVPFFFGGPPAILDLLKRGALAVFAFGLSSPILFVEIAAFSLVIGGMIQGGASPATQADLASNWKDIEGVVGVPMDPVIALSMVGAFLGAVVFAVSCLSEWLGAVLLLVRRLITTFLFFGYSFVFLFVPIFYVTSSVVGAFVGGSAGASVDAANLQQRQQIFQRIPDMVRKFETEHIGGILLGSTLVAGIIALFFAIGISFSDQLPWCRTPARNPKRPVRN